MAGLAYVFPGQGAQAVGMGKGFYDACAVSRDLYKDANAALGFDLTALCFEGPPDALTNTARCQLALFVTSLAALAAFREMVRSAPSPVGMAGLSLGEITALSAAGAFSFRDGLYLVQARGEAMAECSAHHEGAMLAVIGLSDEEIQEICRESGATGANYNAPEQVVLSGTVRAIARAEELAKARKAKRAVRLEVAGAFHSPLMQTAADALKAALAKITIRSPSMPVISNVTGEAVKDASQVPELLIRQLVSPVRWEASMRTLIRSGAGHFIEFPPARVLTGLLRRIDRAVTGVAIDQPADFDKLNPIVKPSTC